LGLGKKRGEGDMKTFPSQTERGARIVRLRSRDPNRV